MRKLTVKDFPRKKLSRTLHTDIGSFLDSKSIQECIDYLRYLEEEFPL